MFSKFELLDKLFTVAYKGNLRKMLYKKGQIFNVLPSLKVRNKALYQSVFKDFGDEKDGHLERMQGRRF